MGSVASRNDDAIEKMAQEIQDSEATAKEMSVNKDEASLSEVPTGNEALDEMLGGLQSISIKDKEMSELKVNTEDTEEVNVNEMSKTQASIFKISTGSEALDQILGGGVESMSITQFDGEWRTGKTQIAHTLCITCQVDGPDYRGGKAIMIDTENTFRPDRLRPIARRYGLNIKEALNNVLYVRAYTSEEQIGLIDLAASYMNENKGEVRILILDSIMFLFLMDYSGQDEVDVRERQERLAHCFSKLDEISKEHNVAVFITNNIGDEYSSITDLCTLDSAPIREILSTASKTRVLLRKGKGENRTAKILGKLDMPDNKATFAISEEGICDIDA